jgi:hypothetical protein
MTKKPPPSYTDRQLKTYEVIQRNYMAWVSLVFAFTAFSVCLAGLLYSAFSGKGEAWLRVGLLVIDGLLGTCITRVFFYLFPRRAVKKN